MSRHHVHGGALDEIKALFPDAPQPWMDLSTGINPTPYPMAASHADQYTHLPTGDAARRCQQAMAEYLGASPDRVLLAPGSELLIRLLPTLITPKRIVLLSPTYGDHWTAWRQTTAVLEARTDPLSQLGEAGSVVVCNPNNPDGRWFPPERLLAAAQQLANRGDWLIVDEAYCDLDPSFSLAPHAGMEGLIILRSFGKFFGLAGLRLGAILAPPRILDAMAQILGYWAVSGPALAVGAQAYADRRWQDQTRQSLRRRAQALDAVLQAAGLSITGGTDLFRFLTCENADALWRQWAGSGIYVRKFSWSDHHLRLGIPTDEAALTRLRRALIPSG